MDQTPTRQPDRKWVYALVILLFVAVSAGALYVWLDRSGKLDTASDFVFTLSGKSAKEGARKSGEPFVTGAVVIAALEAYRAKMGAYPKTLDELKSGFLEVIPPPAWGSREWEYWRGDARGGDPNVYILRVRRERGGFGWHYSSHLKGWLLAQS